ncbi:uncharacterized protein MONOS_2815 [Monocercomonoides exilis]|uniref:uncharacterized protein n=1 Tax=Monocercomonoides exilis TaxID=2049356 RepID=UPI0035598639|nr:hypothetical protein MONOS_2815 [Monocercomonoides exilis]|eukprot:MONOS_2815.1-p1 / transcript=MONOS_2815.1 / gene=MONOS_2815 / organism=Monocercomonoides_exilis_PA203 / gene_product=unspecified product / transcript_product=unspecified product / location=Mono_scaffold00060:106928-107443(+) / protein_length=172 / sequence_SO=supercontig / SO=protein_coding / is_pseudo=false
MSGLVEQLQENDKIIRMRERKILQMSEKHIAEVKELQQLVAMNEKVELIDVGIEKEKKLHSQHGRVASECSEGAVSGAGVSLATPSSLNAPAERVMIPFSSLLILPSGFRKNSNEKLAASIGDCNAVMVGPDPSGKGVVVKVGSGMSVVGRRQRWVERVSTEMEVRERDVG